MIRRIQPEQAIPPRKYSIRIQLHLLLLSLFAYGLNFFQQYGPRSRDRGSKRVPRKKIECSVGMARDQQ
jgi:hypothetical protein